MQILPHWHVLIFRTALKVHHHLSRCRAIADAESRDVRLRRNTIILKPRVGVGSRRLPHGREDFHAPVIVLGDVGRRVCGVARRARLRVLAHGDRATDAREQRDAVFPLRADVRPLSRGEVLVGGVEVDETGGAVARGEIDARARLAGCVAAADDQGVAEPVLRFAGHDFGGPDFGVGFVAVADPALGWERGQVALEHQRVGVGD